MHLQDKNHLVTFLTQWVLAVPWRREGAITANGIDLQEGGLVERLYPNGKASREILGFDELWVRLLAMHLSSMTGFEPRRKQHRRRKIAPRVFAPELVLMGSKWYEVGKEFGMGIALLVELPACFPGSSSSQKWWECSRSLSMCKLPPMPVLNQIYRLAIKNDRLPVLLYKQLMEWLLSLPPQDEYETLRVQRSSIELLLANTQPCAFKQLYMLAISRDQEVAADSEPRDRECIIQLLDSVGVESVAGSARVMLRGIMLDDRTLTDEVCKGAVSHLTKNSRNKEHETILEIAFERKVFSTSYNDMVSWLVHRGSNSGFEKDPDDWTTVGNLASYLLDAGCFPVSEPALLHAISFQKERNYQNNLKALVILIIDGDSRMSKHDTVTKHLQERADVPLPQLKEIFSHIIAHLPRGARRDLYRRAAGYGAPHTGDRDKIIWWTLGRFLPEDETNERVQALSPGFMHTVSAILAAEEHSCREAKSWGSDSADDWDSGIGILEHYSAPSDDPDLNEIQGPIWPPIGSYQAF